MAPRTVGGSFRNFVVRRSMTLKRPTTGRKPARADGERTLPLKVETANADLQVMSRFADRAKKKSRDNWPTMLALLAVGVKTSHTLRTQAHARGVTPRL